MRGSVIAILITSLLVISEIVLSQESLDGVYACGTTKFVEVSIRDSSGRQKSHELKDYRNENFYLKKTGKNITFEWLGSSALWTTQWAVGDDEWGYFNAHASKYSDFLYFDKDDLVVSFFTWTAGIRVASAKCYKT